MANSNDVLPVYIGDDRTDEDAFKVNLSTLFFKVLVKTLCLLLCGKNIFCISCLWECVCVPSVWLRWWMEWNMGAAFWSPLHQKAQVQLTPSVILLRYRILLWLFVHPSSYRKCWYILTSVSPFPCNRTFTGTWVSVLKVSSSAVSSHIIMPVPGQAVPPSACALEKIRHE